MSRFWVSGTGFLGAHVVRHLLDRGHQVVVTSRTGGTLHGQSVAAVDLLDSEAVRVSAEGCDGAFLCSGKVSRDPEDAQAMHELHVFGTRSALAGLRSAGIPRVVVASTSGTVAVGTDPEQVFDEESPVPLDIIARWPYYRSKYYGEREAMAANHPPDFNVVVVNPSLLLGPGDLRDSSTADVRRFLSGGIPAIPSGGLAFVDARDAAAGMRLAFERGRAGERYLLNAKNMTVAAFFQRLERLTGVKCPVLKLPRSRGLALGIHDLFSRTVTAIGGKSPVSSVDVDMAQHYWYSSSAKAERELGFSPRDPGETLRDTVQDLVDRRVVMLKNKSFTPTE